MDADAPRLPAVPSATSPPPVTAPPERVGAAIVGLGRALPAHVVPGRQIADRLGVDEAWITRRTGTRDRHVAGPDERLEHFAAGAARAALADARLDAASVDAVLVGTTTSDEMSPHAAPLVAEDIGARGAAALDVSCACVGFLACLVTGASMIEAGRARRVVAVGADLLSRYLDRDDPQSAMLFGDGAAAVVLDAIRGPSRIGPAVLHADGSERALIRLERAEPTIRMDGPAVFRHAVRLMVEATTEVLDAGSQRVEDVDLFVYHQANSRIIDAVGRQLGLDPARVVDVVARFANTSAASIPLALGAAREEGRLRPGDRVLLGAFGAGLVWGAATVRWGTGTGAPA